MKIPQEETVNACLSEILSNILREHGVVIPEDKIKKMGIRGRY